MRKSLEFTGKTEDAAVAAALEALGLTREEVSVEVLELAKAGFLGIGGTPAKVRVTFEAPDEPEPVVEETGVEEPAAEDDGSVYTAMGAGFAEDEEAAEAERVVIPQEETLTAVPADDATAQKIADFLTGLLAHMEVEAASSITVDEEGNYRVELIGRNLGAVIGRRGETLDAIQQLTGYAVNKGEQKRVRIRVDAEGYRAKREESLERMARRVADKVVRYRRNMTLEPMNAYERHVIHTALQDYPDVTTYSIGVEPNRRTVVAYSQGEHR